MTSKIGGLAALAGERDPRELGQVDELERELGGQAAVEQLERGSASMASWASSRLIRSA